MIKLKQILLEGKLGDCYQASGRLAIEMMGNPKVLLVHGMVNGQGSLEGNRYGHAWLEVGDTIYDHSNGRELELPKRVYYQMGNIQEEDNKYYKSKEALRWMQKVMHWGPWEMSGGVVKLQTEDIPDVRGEIGRRKQRIPSDILDKLDD